MILKPSYLPIRAEGKVDWVSAALLFPVYVPRRAETSGSGFGEHRLVIEPKRTED